MTRSASGLRTVFFHHEGVKGMKIRRCTHGLPCLHRLFGGDDPDGGGNGLPREYFLIGALRSVWICVHPWFP
jgi:hypothetical protein